MALPSPDELSKMQSASLPSPEEIGYVPSMGERFVKGAKELVSPTLGGLKGAARTALGAVESSPLTPAYGRYQAKQIREKLAPQNIGEKLGYGLEQALEYTLPGAAGAKFTKGKGVLSSLIGNALEGATVATAQQGGVNRDVGITGLVSGALPLALKGVGKAIGGLTGGTKRLIDKAVGITGEQARKLNIIATTKDAKTGKAIYDNVQDFLYKKGIIGRGKEILNREDIVNRAKDLLGSTIATKEKLINNIDGNIPNKFDKLIGLLGKKIKSINKSQGGALKEEYKFLKGVYKNPELNVKQVDKIRDIADDLVYSEKEALIAKKLRGMISPLRKSLENIDNTGQLRGINTDIRLLQQLAGKGQILQKASNKSVIGKAGGLAGLAALTNIIPGIGQVVSAGIGAEALTSFPQVAAPLARAIMTAQRGSKPVIKAAGGGLSTLLSGLLNKQR
jgi:hypothetical protein